MDIISINNQIKDNILLLRKTRDTLKVRGEDKAEALGTYEKSLAQTLIKLRNGQLLELEGEEITNPPATIMRDIAKGIVYKERIVLDLAESNYKSATVALDAIKTTINALQSQLRYVDET